MGDGHDAFVGAAGNYQSETNGAFGEYPILAIDSWATLDLRAGLAGTDNRWRVFVWGRNVTDKYYWSSATRVLDTSIRYAAMPATFGITASFRTH